MLPEDQYQFRVGTVLDHRGPESSFETAPQNPGLSSVFGDPQAQSRSRLRKLLLDDTQDGASFGYLRDLLKSKRRTRSMFDAED